MNVLADDNRDRNYIHQQIQEHIRTQPASVIIRRYKTKSDLAQYLHGSCFSPVHSTFLKSIKNNHLLTWLGLNSNIVSKKVPAHLMETVKVHMKQERQHIQ